MIGLGISVLFVLVGLFFLFKRNYAHAEVVENKYKEVVEEVTVRKEVDEEDVTGYAIGIPSLSKVIGLIVTGVVGSIVFINVTSVTNEMLVNTNTTGIDGATTTAISLMPLMFMVIMIISIVRLFIIPEEEVGEEPKNKYKKNRNKIHRKKSKNV